MMAPPVGCSTPQERDRGQCQLGGLIGPEKGIVEQFPLGHVDQDDAELDQQRTPGHQPGEAVQAASDAAYAGADADKREPVEECAGIAVAMVRGGVGEGGQDATPACFMTASTNSGPMIGRNLS